MANTEVSKYAPSRSLMRPSLVASLPDQLGRTVPAKVPGSLPPEICKGGPLCRSVIPLTCHPPTIFPTAPLRVRKDFPGPKGSS
jgi:hypothetical protein